MLQQPHGVPGCCEDQKRTGSHPHDGSHQHESRADHHHAVQPGGWCVFVFALSCLPYHHTLTQITFLPADFTESLPHRPVTRQNPAHPGCNSGEVHAIAVQPPLQDPPPVSHVSVCCHAARRSQLAVPQHHCGTGTGHRRHVEPVNTFTLTFMGPTESQSTFDCSGGPAVLTLEESEALLYTWSLFVMAVTELWA